MEGIAMSNFSAISPTVIGPPARWLRMRRRGVEASALKAFSIDTFLIRKIRKSSGGRPAGFSLGRTVIAGRRGKHHALSIGLHLGGLAPSGGGARFLAELPGPARRGVLDPP